MNGSVWEVIANKRLIRVSRWKCSPLDTIGRVGYRHNVIPIRTVSVHPFSSSVRVIITCMFLWFLIFCGVSFITTEQVSFPWHVSTVRSDLRGKRRPTYRFLQTLSRQPFKQIQWISGFSYLCSKEWRPLCGIPTCVFSTRGHFAIRLASCQTKLNK